MTIDWPLVMLLSLSLIIRAFTEFLHFLLVHFSAGYMSNSFLLHLIKKGLQNIVHVMLLEFLLLACASVACFY
jgi:hypothetical protein